MHSDRRFECVCSSCDALAKPTPSRQPRYATKRKSKCAGAYLCVVFCAAACLVVAITFLSVFLSASDLLVQNNECDADEECCPPELPTVFGVDAQCLLPGNETPACVEHRCVFPEPLHKPDGSPCDDFQFCTVNDACQKGKCSSVPRQCSDADWCTLETCSEELAACTQSLRVEESDVCDTLCDEDNDCRSGYFCLPSKQCGKFSESNSSLFFAGANLVACTDTANGYAMVQHYAVYSEAYRKDDDVRFRVLKSGDDVQLPAAGALDKSNVAGPEADAVPLKALLSLDQAQFFEATATASDTASDTATPAYSRSAFTVRTVCQDMFDDASCRTAWVNRRYDMNLFMTDCVVSDGKERECLPTKIPVAASMSLSLIQCPFTTKLGVAPLGHLRMEYADKPGAPLVEVRPAEKVRAVLEIQQGDVMDPFLMTVSVCSVDPKHRLASCATNTAEHDCPFRGCHGWDPEDSPVHFSKEYLSDYVPQASASLDRVRFCRGDRLGLGCESSRCPWSMRPNRTPLGGADGIEFSVMADPGHVVLVDVEYKVEICRGRRLSNLQETDAPKRSLGILRVT